VGDLCLATCAPEPPGRMRVAREKMSHAAAGGIARHVLVSDIALIVCQDLLESYVCRVQLDRMFVAIWASAVGGGGVSHD
jgi:hypothetical protein